MLYGSENWTIKAREARITAAQIKYRRKTAEKNDTELQSEHNFIYVADLYTDRVFFNIFW